MSLVQPNANDHVLFDSGWVHTSCHKQMIAKSEQFLFHLQYIRLPIWTPSFDGELNNDKGKRRGMGRPNPLLGTSRAREGAWGAPQHFTWNFNVLRARGWKGSRGVNPCPRLFWSEELQHSIQNDPSWSERQSAMKYQTFSNKDRKCCHVCCCAYALCTKWRLGLFWIRSTYIPIQNCWRLFKEICDWKGIIVLRNFRTTFAPKSWKIWLFSELN